MARAVVPGFPHHVTQRGNRRRQTFFNVEGYQACFELMAYGCNEHRVGIWAYCLMPNPFDCGTGNQRWIEMAMDEAQTVSPANQLSWRVVRPFMAGQVINLNDGRTLPAGVYQIRGFESCSGWVGPITRKLEVEQRRSTHQRQGWHVG